jgi:hypothetical protein
MPERTAEEWGDYIEAAIKSAEQDGWVVYVDHENDLVITPDTDMPGDEVWVVEW